VELVRDDYQKFQVQLPAPEFEVSPGLFQFKKNIDFKRPPARGIAAVDK
jgi:hypothetical protein